MRVMMPRKILLSGSRNCLKELKINILNTLIYIKLDALNPKLQKWGYIGKDWRENLIKLLISCFMKFKNALEER